ncbi:MAG: biotin--[acetyl-CoA-carboxylase] ligase [Armatimonadetes bacterium]|nr:MAG: biotin--[acetyl-CoA-carboxylase] ligase [Armatimonadota bacterium]
MATHYDIVHLSEVGSTQDEARDRFAATGVPTLVVADRQVAGRGRQGRSWYQPDQAMFSSLSFRTDWKPEHRTLIPLVTGMAVCDAIVSVGGREPSLKWPNDVLIDGAKVGGILVELDEDQMTVGCGLNLWWADPIAEAGSVFDDHVDPSVALDLARLWSQALLEQLEGPSGAWPEDRYIEQSATLGRQVLWDEGAGIAIGLTPSGALIVDTAEGIETIHAGEVHMRGWR